MPHRRLPMGRSHVRARIFSFGFRRFYRASSFCILTLRDEWLRNHCQPKGESSAMTIKPLLLTLLVSPLALTAQAPKPTGPPPTLKSVLLAQLRSTHNKAEWFVPVNTAIAG